MLSEELYEQVLLRCVRLGCDELRIVSGYASPEMCTRLVLDAHEAGQDLSIDLIVGMVGADGIADTSHRAFQAIHGDSVGMNSTLRVRYSRPGLGVHSKVFVWVRDGRPFEAWVGSANFTQAAFGQRSGQDARRMEVMTQVSSDEAQMYFERTAGQSLELTDAGVRVVSSQRHLGPGQGEDSLPSGDWEVEDSGVESYILPLVALQSNLSTGTTRGGVHARAGLNWGQRPEHAREPNQAYIPVPAPIRESDFFPEPGVVFRVVTDDDTVLLMSRAQAGGKALQTPQDNSLLGRYFRRRLGVPAGAPVTTSDLIQNGSRFVRLTRGMTPEGEFNYQMVYAQSLEVEGSRLYEL